MEHLLVLPIALTILLWFMFWQGILLNYCHFFFFVIIICCFDSTCLYIYPLAFKFYHCEDVCFSKTKTFQSRRMNNLYFIMALKVFPFEMSKPFTLSFFLIRNKNPLREIFLKTIIKVYRQGMNVLQS